jgi:multidrug efflux pump
VAVMISLVISLTTTPMMCAWLLKPAGAAAKRPPGRLARWAEAGYQRTLRAYETSLDWALSSLWLVLFILVAVIALNVYLFAAAPKGFFPRQDSGQLQGGLRADQSISSQAMGEKLRQVVDIISRDPAVATVVGFTGGGRAGGGFMFVNLKPLAERTESGQAVIARLRPQLAQVTGLSVFLNPVQDVRAGGRQSSSTYQYTLKSDSLADLRVWATRLAERMKQEQEVMVDVDTDQQDNGVETRVEVDRDSAARLGLTSTLINSALYNAFGQRQVATIYDELNQYKVVMEWAPRYTQGPNALSDVYVPSRGQIGTATTAATSAGAAASAATAAATTTTAVAANPGARDSSTGNALSNTPTTLVPLTAVARFRESATPTSISHQDAELATTVSFNLAEGKTLDDAAAAIRQAEADIGMPTNVRGSFQGTARAAQQSQGQQAVLIVAAIAVIYLVLGMLYESLVHPVTVLSTLPSAGVGAVLALLAFRMEFSIIALIGVFLLIGIVKKNAILIIDFALEAERTRGLSAIEAVREACLLRFRPILMTTLAAALGALPLAIGFGEGAELRRPLGVSIVGGLIASQLLTLLTTPVVYVLLDKLRTRRAARRPPSAGPNPNLAEATP